VRVIDAGGVIRTLAGNGSAAFAGDAGDATLASLARPMGLGVDALGDVYIADSNNQRVRVVTQGLIATVAGDGDQGYSGDNGAAVNAALNVPVSVAVNSSGDVVIADSENEVVREIAGDKSINTAAGSGPAGTLTVQLSGAAAAAYGAGTINATILHGSSPTGTVTLQEQGSAVVASGTLVNGSVLLSTGMIDAGVHDLLASYAGDGQNPAAVSGLFVLLTTPASLTVTADNATREYGTPNPVFTGEVLGVVNNDGITATFASTATVASPAGNFAITGTVDDPNNRLPNYALTLTPGTLTISKAATLAALQTSVADLLLDNSVVFTAAVTSSTTGTPTGVVHFLDGGVTLGSATLNGSGTASLSVATLTAGAHSITTVYAGDGNFLGHTSSALSETVQDFQFSGDSTATVATALLFRARCFWR
jgi:hypothetical protein